MFFEKSYKRRALLGVGLASCLPMLTRAQTAPWPAKPIKLIVPFSPGGSNDVFARVLATKLAARLGQPILVENKLGSGGTIGTEYVAKSAPDGYTLLFASASITTNAAFGKKLSYDLTKDLLPIGRILTTPFCIVVSNNLKVNSLKELIALAQSKPGSINYGSAGIGGMNHLGAELFASAAKIDLVHVPYKGIAPAFTDLMSGNLQMLVPSLASVTPYIQSNKMRGLAVTSSQRSSLAPAIPTASEAGLQGFELEVWYGLFAPAGMPAPIVKKLNEELNAVLMDPSVKEVFAKEAATALPGTPDDLAKLIRSELTRWARVISEKNIQLD
jgi:tripartite-type tricarboxylate transporter receptor subunit TctC